MPNKIDNLHKRCKIYNTKKILKALFFVSLIVVIPFSYFLFVDENKENKKEIIKETVQAKKVQNREKTIINKKEKSLPSYSLNLSSDKLEKSILDTKSKQKIKKVKNTKKIKPVKLVKPVKKDIQVQEVKKEKINYFEDKKEEYRLEDWIAKYNSKKSYSLAIYISKAYYKQSEYKQSGIWAKRANQLNRNKEEAWLYYAKSVYSLGDVEKAKKILKVFLRYKESSKANILLSEWGK